MELKIVEQSKQKLIVEVQGEDHTFCNALKKELWNDEHIKASAYSISHPLVGQPRIIVETDGKEEPKDALLAAAKRLSKDVEKFIQLAEKNLE